VRDGLSLVPLDEADGKSLRHEEQESPHRDDQELYPTGPLELCVADVTHLLQPHVHHLLLTRAVDQFVESVHLLVLELQVRIQEEHLVVHRELFIIPAGVFLHLFVIHCGLQVFHESEGLFPDEAPVEHHSGCLFLLRQKLLLVLVEQGHDVVGGLVGLLVAAEVTHVGGLEPVADACALGQLCELSVHEVQVETQVLGQVEGRIVLGGEHDREHQRDEGHELQPVQAVHVQLRQLHVREDQVGQDQQLDHTQDYHARRVETHVQGEEGGRVYRLVQV